MDKIETEKRHDLAFSEIDKVNAQLKKMEKEKAAGKKVTIAEKKRSVEIPKKPFRSRHFR